MSAAAYQERGPEEAKSQFNMALKIDKVPVDDPEYVSEVPLQMRNEQFPGFPSCSLFVGSPGSGKTNCLIYMLLSPTFWNGFFDKVKYFGPTCKSDKLYKNIKKDDGDVCTDEKEFLPKLQKELDEIQSSVETSAKEAKKTLMIFEDMTSYYDKLQKSPQFVRCYVQIRHLKASSVCMVHKYKAFNRTCRMACNHLLIWECNRTEVDMLYEDFAPRSFTKDQWGEMVEYALKPTEEEPKPFFYINRKQPWETRFRRNFTQVLRLRPDAGITSVKDGMGNPRKSLSKPKRKSTRRSRSLSPDSERDGSKSKRDRDGGGERGC